MRDMNNVCRVINKLYEQGFYKRIHMYIKLIYEDDTEWAVSVRGLEKLYLAWYCLPMNLALMPEIKELGFFRDGYSDNYEEIAKNLVNLERIYFKRAHRNVITPFLKFATKLKKIKIDHLVDTTHLKNDVINLVALNKERSSLNGANRVTIYVEEHIFLKTKFALNKTALSLISLKRAETIEWTHQFS